MDDFLSIIVVVALYLAIAAGGNKKKKTRNTKQRASRTREAAFDQVFGASGKASARTTSSQEKETLARNEACASSRIHLHEVTQQQFDESVEGEDPCHRGGADAVQDVHASAEFSYDEVQREQSAIAQDVLRGVIMSEILTRPSDRAAIRRNGRSVR